MTKETDTLEIMLLKNSSESNLTIKLEAKKYDLMEFYNDVDKVYHKYSIYLYRKLSHVLNVKYKTIQNMVRLGMALDEAKPR